MFQNKRQKVKTKNYNWQTNIYVFILKQEKNIIFQNIGINTIRHDFIALVSYLFGILYFSKNCLIVHLLWTKLILFHSAEFKKLEAL